MEDELEPYADAESCMESDINYVHQAVDHEEIIEPSKFDIEESRRIRNEQDKAFAESLKIDQEKVF